MSCPRHRIDLNQPSIVQALEAVPAKVMPIESPEEGHPDLLVGFVGELTLLEVKRPRVGRLSAAQKRRHAEWAAVGVRVHVVRTAKEALAAIGAADGDKRRKRQQALQLLADGLASQRYERKRFQLGLARVQSSKRDYRHNSAWEEAWDGDRSLPAGKDLSQGPA
jgi:hypothetical protein